MRRALLRRTTHFRLCALLIIALLLMPARAGEPDRLLAKLNQFAEAYNVWIIAYDEGHFDLKGAKELIERSGEWPR
jgi:hypothetical protein